MKKRQGMTLLELLIVIFIIAIVAGLLIPALARKREEERRIRCRNNLNQLAKAMDSMYLDRHSDNRFYPCPLGRGRVPGTYNGAEWLASLYWTGYVPDPGVFLCPSTTDSNADGKDLGCKRANDCGGTFGSQTVSYAGLWWKSVDTQNGGAIRDDWGQRDEPMACDDTQGGINHGQADNGGMSVLFFDSHVEFIVTPNVDVSSTTGSVGKGFPNPPATLLWRLRN